MTRQEKIAVFNHLLVHHQQLMELFGSPFHNKVKDDKYYIICDNGKKYQAVVNNDKIYYIEQ